MVTGFYNFYKIRLPHHVCFLSQVKETLVIDWKIIGCLDFINNAKTTLNTILQRYRVEIFLFSPWGSHFCGATAYSKGFTHRIAHWFLLDLLHIATAIHTIFLRGGK